MVENLAVKNMVKNPKLSQAVSDVSWGEITRQLAYKCRWYGRNYLEIDRWFPSSKRCSNCGYITEKMPLNIREWDCPDCGTHHDRDINASKNIWFFVTWYGSIGGHKSTKSLSGKRLN